MATRAEIQAALAHYEQAGNADAARKLKATLEAMPPDTDGTSYSTPKAAPPSVGEQIVGGVETAATLATGAIAAPIAGLGAGIYETTKQILHGHSVESGTAGDKAVTDTAERAAEAVTYIPRSEAGRGQVQAVGEAIEPVASELPALTAAGPELSAIASSARTAASMGRAATEASGIPTAIAKTAARAGTAVTDAASKASAAARKALSPKASETPAGFGADSAGAAAVPAADLRRAGAAELGFKGDARLTKGQATQDTTEIGFEREQAKHSERGTDVRARYDAQRPVIANTFDKFVDETGGAVPDFSGGGKVNFGRGLEKALSSGAEAQKNKVNVLYTTAKKTEGGNPSRGDSVAAYLNENENVSSPLVGSIRAEAKKLGILDKDGKPAETTVNTLHELRKFVSRAASPADGFQAKEIKRAIDAQMLADGGPLYKQAIAARARFGAQYEDASLINGIIENRPGSPDRIIAADQILDRIISKSTSVDEVKHMRNLLQRHGGESGAQAWKDLQAGAIEHLRDVTYGKTQAGANGAAPRPNVTQLSNAVSNLDKAGKLDLLFTPRGAEKVRLFRDVVKAIENTEGANYSGTSNAFIQFLESIPVGGKSVTAGRKLFNTVDSHVRDGKLRARLKENLK